MEIKVTDGGPLLLSPTTDLKIVDHEGKEITFDENKPMVALCRCGKSANKPFCDGTHMK